MLLSFPLPERLSGGSASALSAFNDGSVSVGLVKPSNTEPLYGEAWVVSLGFSRSFVLCFKWDPTWDRMTCGFEFTSKLNPPFVERLQECRFLTL